MRTSKTIGKVIARAGRELVLEKEEGIRHFQGYLNPICNKGELLEPMEGGRWDRSKWLLICPVNTVTRSIKAGDMISNQGGRFCIESLRKVYWGKREAHIWGIAVEARGNILME